MLTDNIHRYQFFISTVAVGTPDPTKPHIKGPVEQAVTGYKSGPCTKGPAVTVMRLPDESVEALQARCGELFPAYMIWLPTE